MSGLSQIKGILFDLDGTILDTKEAYIEAAKVAFKTLEHCVPDDGKLLEIPKRIEQKRPISEIIGEDEKTFLPKYLEAFYNVAALRTRPVPGAQRTLCFLSEKAKLAVITMRLMPSDRIVAELNHHNLSKYITHIVTALDTQKPKPSPEALIKAVKAMDIEMCECLIVGDSVVDVKAGKAAGIKTVAVLSGLYSRKELSEVKPDFILSSIRELPKLLN